MQQIHAHPRGCQNSGYTLYPLLPFTWSAGWLHFDMDDHTDFQWDLQQTLKDLCLKLAHFILTNNYKVWGAPLPSSGRDSHAPGDVVFCRLCRNLQDMVGDFESPIVNDGPAAVLSLLCFFRRALTTNDADAISLNWSSCKSHQEAVNPSLVTAKRHMVRSTIQGLDLDMSLQPRVRSRTGAIRVLFPPDLDYSRMRAIACCPFHKLRIGVTFSKRQNQHQTGVSSFWVPVRWKW